MEPAISNVNWEEQSVFALDFDKGTVTVEEIYSKFNELGIVPQLWYTTFSDSTIIRKFRVVIFLETPITDVSIHKLIHSSLISMFPEVYTSCKDASRYFFGGKNSNIIHTNPLSTSIFIDSLAIKMYSSDSNSFRKVPLETITKSTEKPAFLYNIYRNTQISAEFPSHTPTSVEGGNKVKTTDTTMSHHKIEYNGFRFKFNCFDHEEL